MLDIFECEVIRKAEKLIDLLHLIALHVGQEAKTDEIPSSPNGISRTILEVYPKFSSKVNVYIR